MAPKLSSRAYILARPAIIGFGWDHPIYCKVKKVGPRVVQVEGLHDAAGHTWSVKRAEAAQCVVTSSEVRSATTGPLLFQAVMINHAGGFHHGQVIAAAQNQVTVRLLDESVLAAPSEVTPVAPAVALLLEALVFGEDSWSLDELVEVHHTILDRICGTSSTDGSNVIGHILEGIVGDSSMPQSQAEMTWISPKTGEEAHFPLQHAVDYVHYIDGDVQPVPDSVGISFWQPPTRESSTHTPSTSSRPPRTSETSLFDPQVDDDDDSICEPTDHQSTALSRGHIESSRKRSSSVLPASQPATRQRVEFQPPDNAAMDAQIAHLLLGRPELTERFLQLRSDAGPRILQPTPETHEVLQGQPRFLRDAVGRQQDGATTTPTISYVEATPAQPNQAQREVEPRSKYAFVPSVTQRRVHALATALHHQGKSAAIFVEALINSISVLFKPFPSVLGRVFAIDFGVRGLSVMHFAPFHSLNDKAVWIMTGGANMQNFSAAVSVPAAPPASSIDDILEALQSLAIYGAEYFSPTLCGLIDTMVTFTKQQLRRMTWQKADLVLVVYWMNSILENFRMELEQGTSDGSQIKTRCSVDDPEFRQILIHIQQRQIADLQEALAVAQSKRPQGTAKPAHVTQSLDNPQRRQTRAVKVEHSIPADVYAALPIEDGKRLCLRFLSTAGCKANNGKQCLSANRAHFVPDKLEPIVRDFIGKRFGGVKPEYSSL